MSAPLSAEGLSCMPQRKSLLTLSQQKIVVAQSSLTW